MPVAVASLLVQARLIWVALTAVAVRLVGAGGGCGAACVVALAVLENADLPAGLMATNSKVYVVDAARPVTA